MLSDILNICTWFVHNILCILHIRLNLLKHLRLKLYPIHLGPLPVVRCKSSQNVYINCCSHDFSNACPLKETLPVSFSYQNVLGNMSCISWWILKCKKCLKTFKVYSWGVLYRKKSKGNSMGYRTRSIELVFTRKVTCLH